MIRSRAIWTVVSMLAAAAGASAAAAHGTGASACAGLFDRRLEVCVAYVADATIAARVPYYALARSPNPARARLVRNRLESRYVGAARLALERQVARWPRGTQHVEPPRVEIVSVTVTGDTARIVTHESWRVSTATGRVLFAETAKRHVVTMRRVPGLVLHKWVVAGLGPAPTG